MRFINTTITQPGAFLLLGSQKCMCGFGQCISVRNKNEGFIHFNTKVNRERTECKPSVPSYIDKKQNGLAATRRAKSLSD